MSVFETREIVNINYLLPRPGPELAENRFGMYWRVRVEGSEWVGWSAVVIPIPHSYNP